ncbi:P-loop containing nucleoside triphosphate hydrolase protein [Lophiostoma macrostomum CBS 122681]|uniref:RNA helicase n=1 Tax=Lophiostoma macrostomum CBS 122681 TaxID=1314788 RepID=A0A6A6TQ56_9PLEO|nr:P-loop containing nucleoside triphosphate hydrolase protein [Lophiostoma macrostomum CBS 122681]
MASRGADNFRGPRDDHYSRRDRRRDDDRYDDRRARDRGRFDDRERDSYRRRSRSPRRDRHRSRDRGDRYGDDRHHRRDRSRTHDRDAHRDRDRDRYRDRSRDRRHTSASATPGADVTRNTHDRGSDRTSRDDRHKDAPEKSRPVKEDKAKSKIANLEKWKAKRLAELAAKEQAEAAAAGQSPAASTPATPASASTPPKAEIPVEPAKTKVLSVSGTAEKAKQSQKGTIKLDETAKARPLQGQVAGKPVASVNGNKSVPTKSVKANGNIGSFGLKAKATTEVKADKNALLDDGEGTKKRTFQALPDFNPEDGPSPPADAEGASPADVGSDDEDANAKLQAHLEKRREEIANEDTNMEDAPPTGEAGDKMDVDNTTGAEEEDVDPLDAFMAGLTDEPSTGLAPQGQAIFADEQEPTQEAAGDADMLALTTAKKKRKEIKVVDHSKETYPPFRKNFYTEPREVSEMTPEEVADLRLDLDGIKVKPDNVPRPVTKWAQMGLLQQTMDVFTQVGYDRPTSIQAQAIPIAESGHDLIGVAKTGSGKTLAFGIPIIRHILDQPPLKSADGPIVLILAPTRELSLQIVNELRPFLRASKLKIACAYGGAPISEQIAAIKRGGIHVLCATPGRLIDLLQSNSGRVLSFKRITYVVLDEADRMFDMGFEPQVMKILAGVRPDRQTILFSATFPKNMAALAKKALTNPVEVIIGGRSVVAPEITQVITVVPPSPEKKMTEVLRQLGNLFSADDDVRALIFVERQETAEDLLSKVLHRGYACNSIHGRKDQQDRSEAINDFKAGALPVLIATSVAARGLDVPQLKLVINYDCPTHLEDYVHRCGRTGRAGNTGTAVTLIEDPGQERFAIHLSKALTQSGQPVPEKLKEMVATFKDKVKSGVEKWYDPGFGGKGLDKLEKARAQEKKREKQAHKSEFDDGGNDSDDEKGEISLPTVVQNTATTPTTDENKPPIDDEPAYMKLLRSKPVVNKTERAAEPTKPMSAVERAKAAAAAVDGRLGKKGMIHHGQPIDNKGPDAGAYHSTIEINDFPQKARWAVTNRTNVAKILDATGTSITTKGTYYAAGKEPGETDLPKLYILVEGDTENVVTQAMMELTRLLREGTMAAEDTGPRGATGRYSVV